jgi:hypothetical protein
MKLTKTTMKKPTGYLIHEGDTNGQKFFVVATLKSTNEKTGAMIQVFIMLADVHPAAAVKSGLDAHTICQGCPFASGKGCYVNIAFAPSQVYNGYKRGIYPKLFPKDYKKVFGGKKVRFGAYGNPTLLPFSVAKAIAKVSAGWTGYFHNWNTMKPAEARKWNGLFMASTETQNSYKLAKEMNLRVFHVSPFKPLENAIECVNSSHQIKCQNCLLCAGLSKPAKDIWIAPHGNAGNTLPKALKSING